MMPNPNKSVIRQIDDDERDFLAADLIEHEASEVRDNEQRADTKAGTLATVLGLIGAGVIGLVRWASLPAAAATVLWVSMIPFGLALVRLLWVIRPEFSEAPFRRYGASTPEQLVTEFRHAARIDSASLQYQAFCLHVHSRATVRKLAAIRAAVGLILFGLAGLVIASVLAAAL